MRKLMLLVAAGSLWLFLAALPVLADGGPHDTSINSGVDSLDADSCAGCHRAHTAQGPYLINQPSDELLCLSCHGVDGLGATTDVDTGVQYAIASGLRGSLQVGALRGGGFEEARIGDPYRYMVGTSMLSKVQVMDDGAGLTDSAPVTSAHMPGLAGLTQPGTAWGNGANGTGAGNPVAGGLSCATCHNPHGNGKYRILNPVPVSDIFNASTAAVFNYTGTTAVYKTVASHGFLVGDTVMVTGNTNTAANVGSTTAPIVVATVPSDVSFTLTGVIDTTTGTGGTVARIDGVSVTDAPAIAPGEVRNYTVIQTSEAAGFTLTATEALAFDPTDGDYFHYKVPWNGIGDLGVVYNYDAPNTEAGTPVLSSGRWSIATGERTFSQEITAWCSSCHTRYYARSEPKDANGGTGAAYNTARPSTDVYNLTPDPVFTYQHRTNGASNRGCLTCHVTHGSNAVMDGAYSSAFTYPDAPGGAVPIASDSSRLLKVDNRGTCQLCHDPTETATAFDNVGPIPSVP